MNSFRIIDEKYRYTALQYAIMLRNMDCIDALLRHGADPNIEGQGVDHKDGNKAYFGTCWDWLQIKANDRITTRFEEEFIKGNIDCATNFAFKGLTV